MLEIEDGPDLPQLIDVRDADSFAAGHLPGALRIAPGELVDRLDPDRTVVLYAGEDAAAIDASYLLKRAGRTDVLALAGGLAAWERAGNPVESDA